MRWYKTTRKYVASYDVYVRAESPEKAVERVNNADWDGETGEEIERYYKTPKPKKVPGVPRSIWEDLGYPDDVKITT